MKTGVHSVRKALKTLDSGFRRNDVKKNQIDFFTPSGGKGGVIRVRKIEIFHFDRPHPAPLPHGEREFQMDPF